MGPHIVRKRLSSSLRPPKLICFLIISLSLPGTDPLRVEMGESPVKSLRNKEAIIPCTISDWGSGVMDMNKLSAEWTQTFLDGRKKQVYEYRAGRHTVTRPGSYISDSEIIRGNAGLHLPGVQITDEGEYTCTVIYTPNKVEGKSALLVSGLPGIGEIICNKYPPKYGEPLTLSCEVIGCKAGDVTAEWQMGNNPITRGMRRETQTNRDSVLFLLTLTPTAEHCGKLFTCLIKHKDLPQPIKKNICLKLPAPTSLPEVVPKKRPADEVDGPVIVEEIECVTPNPRKGESITLQCKIKGQVVEHGDFSWSDGIFPIDDDESLIDNSNLTDGSGCISKVTFTPDDGEIRFEATFNFVTTERTFQLP